MRLDPAEAGLLPLAAALLDARGDVVAATPEWRGGGPGSHVYRTGSGQLVVAPDVSTPHLDRLVTLLTDSLDEAATSRAATGPGVVAGGLALLAGRPLASLGEDRLEGVFRRAADALGARTRGLAVAVRQPVPRLRVPAPGAVALAIVQLAVNAWQHEGVDEVVLRAASGPTLYVEWRARPPPARARRHRGVLRRRRSGWGWSYVRMVADALGGSALPAGPTRPGMEGACLGLGSAQLTLPLASVRGGRLERCTLAWERLGEGPRGPGGGGGGPRGGRPELGRPLDTVLDSLLGEAARRPGKIVSWNRYRARSARGRTWLALTPAGAAARVRDLLSGLRHERALWGAAEQCATRAHALGLLLGSALGEPLPTVPPSVWEACLPAACATLHAPTPAPVTAVVLPEPRLAAYLLAEVGGRLVVAGDEVRFQPAPGAAHPALAALRRDPAGLLRLT